MSLTNLQATEGPKRDYPLPKAGLRLGVLSGIIDVGVQNRKYKGKVKPPARMVIFQFSLAKDTFEDDEGNIHHIKVSKGPFTLTPGADRGAYKECTDALDPKPRQVLNDNGGGDITKLVGKACYLTIVHTAPNTEGKQYANIEGVTQLPEDTDVPAIPFEPFVFDTSAPTQQAVDRLTSYQKDLVRRSVGYAGSVLEKFIESEPGSGGDNEGDDKEDNEDSPI